MSAGHKRKRFWLAKVPNWILDDWKKNNAPGHTLGYIVIDPKKKVGNTRDMRLHLTTRDPDLPKELKMSVRTEPASMMVFSERAEKIKLEGGVEVTCDVRPQDNTEYRKLLMRRHKKATVKTAVIKMMPATGTAHERTDIAQVNNPYGKMVIPERRPVERYTPKPKRARMDREALENLLFRLFDKKLYYNINELVGLTDQPKAFLKDVLLDICDHHKTGNYIHHYSLKAKYRTAGEEISNDVKLS